MANHFEPMGDECPYSGSCDGDPFQCSKCKKNPKNKPFGGSPWIVPFEPYPSAPRPWRGGPRWEYTCMMR